MFRCDSPVEARKLRSSENTEGEERLKFKDKRNPPSDESCSKYIELPVAPSLTLFTESLRRSLSMRDLGKLSSITLEGPLNVVGLGDCFGDIDTGAELQGGDSKRAGTFRK